VPLWVLYYKRYRRFSQFERQFPEALDILSRAVRAGYAFTTGLQLIADEMPDPDCGEFRRTFEQQNLGLPLRDAFFNLSLRVPLPDVRIFVSTMQIQSETGGNLAETLDNLSRIVRERFRLLRQVRTYTAEGRLSLYFLTAIPPFMVVLLYL
jgi:tight adherence protein B